MILADLMRTASDRVRMVEFSQSNQDEGVSGVRLTICVRPAVIGTALLWMSAIALMTWDALDGSGVAEKGRWALLLGIAAGTWTLGLVMHHCRRVILEVMSYEHRMQMLDEEADGETCTVRALRR